jgi:hypothetical protein
MSWASFWATFSQTHLGRFFVHFFCGKFRGKFSPKNVGKKLIFRRKSFERNSAEFSAESDFLRKKMYEKLAPGHPVRNPPGLAHGLPEGLPLLRVGRKSSDRARPLERAAVLEDGGEAEARDRSADDGRAVPATPGVNVIITFCDLGQFSAKKWYFP